MLSMGGLVLVQSTSDHSEKLSLAIFALSEIATKKTLVEKIPFESELDVFCNALLARNDEFQTQFINDLCHQLGSTDPILEQFIPEAARKLGQMWKDDKVSFLDVSFGIDRLQKLVRIYEKKYLGPLYHDYQGPPVLLILPKSETHSLGIITASIIMRKNGVNPFLALGYSQNKLFDLINSIDFKLLGLSASCSNSLDECVKIGKTLKKEIKKDIPLVLGSSIEDPEYEKELKKIFSKITKDPLEAINLIQ